MALKAEKKEKGILTVRGAPNLDLRPIPGENNHTVERRIKKKKNYPDR